MPEEFEDGWRYDPAAPVRASPRASDGPAACDRLLSPKRCHPPEAGDRTPLVPAFLPAPFDCEGPCRPESDRPPFHWPPPVRAPPAKRLPFIPPLPNRLDTTRCGEGTPIRWPGSCIHAAPPPNPLPPP